jgi:thiol-disulfide isomerase/thioredoxin
MPLSVYTGNKTSQEVRDRVSRSGRPVILKFSLEYCPPCRLLASDLQSYETPYVLEIIEVQRSNNDDFEGLASAYGITSYPTLVIVDSSMNMLDKMKGYSHKKDLTSFIEKNAQHFEKA